MIAPAISPMRSSRPLCSRVKPPRASTKPPAIPVRPPRPARATRNREELRRREGLMQDPPQKSIPGGGARCGAPSDRECRRSPDDAVRDGGSACERAGGTAARASRLQIAFSNTRTEFAVRMDIAGGSSRDRKCERAVSA